MFKKVLLSIAIVSMIVAPILVSAAVKEPTNQNFNVGSQAGNTGLREGEQLLDFISSTIRVVLGVLGAILLLLIIYGGFTYATAAGDEKKVAKGRQILTYAIIGIVIIAIAWIATDYIISNILVGNTGTSTK